jgi:hypothetical protein
MRVFSGVVLGYLLFEFLWIGMFGVTNTDPHAPANIAFELGTIVCGLLFAGVAGHFASFIGGRPHFIAAKMVGVLVALTAIVTMIRKVVAWPQVFELLFMAPMVVAGGWSYVIRRRMKESGGAEQ